MKLNLQAAGLLYKVWIRQDGLALLGEEPELPALENYHIETEGDSFVYRDSQGCEVRGYFFLQNEEIVFWINGYSYRFTLVPEAAARQEDAENEVLADLPGKVIRLLVSQGDQVVAGAPLVVLEAMKMEHTLRAKTECEIAEILVREGEQVQDGQVLIALKPLLRKA